MGNQAFDNKREPTDKQEAYIKRTPGIRVLEQTRSGAILFVDMDNPHKPIYVLTPKGVCYELYNYYSILR